MWHVLDRYTWAHNQYYSVRRLTATDVEIIRKKHAQYCLDLRLATRLYELLRGVGRVA